jgi:acyl-coenzyme A thioesterase PaaI-like protein
MIELPHTKGCLVCGTGNPHGLQLSLMVDPASGVVSTEFVPGDGHIGFEGIVHGGIIATVFDEAMVWAATWFGKRFCVCGELSVRYRSRAGVGQRLLFSAKVEFARPKLIETAATLMGDGRLLATAQGKYVPVDFEQSRRFMETFVDQESTQEAAEFLRSGR